MPLFPMPGLRVGAHVELFKEDEETGDQILVHTSRPCGNCGMPLDGVVIPKGKSQVHAVCPDSKEIVRG